MTIEPIRDDNELFDGGPPRRLETALRLVKPDKPKIISRAAITKAKDPAAERTKLLRFLKRNVDNVIFLTTDVHAVMVNDVRFQTLEPGGPVDSGITEVITGPVAAMTFAKEIDSVTRSPGSGVLISGLFFKPAPLRGVGMRCVAPDVFSYAEVSVTSSTLTVTSKDAGGHVVTDVTGQPCPPVVLHAQSG